MTPGLLAQRAACWKAWMLPSRQR